MFNRSRALLSTALAYVLGAMPWGVPSSGGQKHVSTPTSKPRRSRCPGPARTRPAVKYLTASPVVNGVRMRWEKGRLVPRVKA